MILFVLYHHLDCCKNNLPFPTMDREYLITCVNLFKKISQAKERIPTQRMINLAQQMGGGVIDTTGKNQIIENMLSFFVLAMYNKFNSFETIKTHINTYMRAKYELSSFDAPLLVGSIHRVW